MPRGLSYADAVAILGESENQTIQMLDRLTGGLLLLASATGFGFALNLLDPKSELFSLSGSLVSKIGKRLRGANRLTRTEQLAAAHAVLVLTAYFDCVRHAELPFDIAQLDLNRKDQIMLTSGNDKEIEREKRLADALLRADIPMLVPQHSHTQTLRILESYYQVASERVMDIVVVFAGWDKPNLSLTEEDRETLQKKRAKVSKSLMSEIPARATARYEELFGKLADDCPEVAFWANMTEHRTTHTLIHEVASGLTGLEQLLSRVASCQTPDERRNSLGLAHRAALDAPILSAGDSIEGLNIPRLSDAYLDPNYRVVQPRKYHPIADESWWDKQPLREDLEGFLIGYLTTPQATQGPLVILGQPGSGKSALTQVLAARLPPGDFLAVRVVLRETFADTDIQAQIESALRAATGEALHWPDLVRTAPGALPVVLLDGFDELLQATGVGQADYLEKVAAFQLREASQGRPVAVAVTSRTAVADRARLAENTVAVCLEPFNTQQIERWLEVWNDANRQYFASRELRPLSPQAISAHAELARQPLLLLMLALYDAEGNPLQPGGAALGKAELYEQLLTRFAWREVYKNTPALSSAELRQTTEQELLRLAVVAFSMFNRNRQWVTEAELNDDIPALLGQPAGRTISSSLRAAPTSAQVVISRFFFIHEAKAIRDTATLATYEFLHATFGEYLIARLIVRELSELVDIAQLNLQRSRAADVADGFLHALLSFAPLTMRDTIASFLVERFAQLTAPQRDHLPELLLDLVRRSLEQSSDSRFSGYAPGVANAPARIAAYSANLVLLTCLAAGEVTSEQLFPGQDSVDDWRRLALLWRSQLPEVGWRGLTHRLAISRAWHGGRRIIRIGLQMNSKSGVDFLWALGINAQEVPQTLGLAWMNHDHGDIYSERTFLCDADDDILVHALEPFFDDLSTMLTTYHSFGGGRPVSAAHALLRLWLMARWDSAPTDLTAAYDTCLKIALTGFATSDRSTRKEFRILFLRTLAVDWRRLPATWRKDALEQIDRQTGDSIHEVDNFADIFRRFIPHPALH